jgi:uncharacterized caspase-like protein
MKYLIISLLLIHAITHLSAQEFKSITVGEYTTTIKEKRLALVIGNNEYSEVSKLSNPIKDAKAIKTALEACGFDVIIHENGTEKSIKEKVREFSEKLKTYDVGMFYYSGHGIEVNGVNYIAPVDIVRTASATDIAEECVATEYILSKMSEAGRTNKTYIMVLDACRDNPFKNIFKDLGNQTWKAPSVIPSGSITCFAASQGEKAIEGKELSPYTELFLKHMKSPGLKIEDVFKRVRIDLEELKKINPQIAQEPVELNKLTTEFFFLPVNDSKIPQADTKPVENKNDLATLKILSTADGTIKIDGVQKGSIKANDVKVYDLKPGKYIVQLFTDGDNLPLNEEIYLSAAKTETLKFDILSKNPNKPQTESNKAETDKIENNTLVISVKGQKLEIYTVDLEQITFDEARKTYEKLGAGWRIPTNSELEEMYYQLHNNGKGNFKSEDYWSSSPTSYGNWAIDFKNGSKHNGSSQNTKKYVRLVREYCKNCPRWIYAINENKIIPGRGLAGLEIGMDISSVTNALGIESRTSYNSNISVDAKMYELEDDVFLGIYFDGNKKIKGFRLFTNNFNKNNILKHNFFSFDKNDLISSIGKPLKTDNHYTCTGCKPNYQAETYYYNGISFWICDCNNKVTLLDID